MTQFLIDPKQIKGLTSAQTGAFLLSTNNLSDVSNLATALNNLLPAQAGFSGCSFVTNGLSGNWIPIASGDTGIVVSYVGLSGSGIFTVIGSPIVNSGNITIGLSNENANLILAGPSNGGAATPTFRTLVSGDIPSSIILPGTPAIAVIPSNSDNSSNIASTSWITNYITGIQGISGRKLVDANNNEIADWNITGLFNLVVPEKKSFITLTTTTSLSVFSAPIYYINISALPTGTIFIPSASGINMTGVQIIFKCINTGIATLNDSVSSGIYSTTLTSNFILKTGDSATLHSNGSFWSIL